MGETSTTGVGANGARADGNRPAVSTAGYQAPPPGDTPGTIVSFVRRIEGDGRIDRPATALAALASSLVRSPQVADGMRGTWLGHALHPLLTDFPLGAWMSASFLDLFGGPDARRPAQRLIGFGLVAAVPTVASGLAEWQDTAHGARRVGVVHAAVNSSATALYGWSWILRRRGAHAPAVGIGVVGGLVATFGGYLGGHLSLVRKIGTADARFGPDRGAPGAVFQSASQMGT